MADHQLTTGATRPVEFLGVRPSLPVQDVARSVSFYQDVVGLELTHLAPDGSQALLRCGAAELMLEQADEPATQEARLDVRGVDVLHTRCLENRVEIVKPLTVDASGVCDFAFVDPDGHGIDVAERRRI